MKKKITNFFIFLIICAGVGAQTVIKIPFRQPLPFIVTPENVFLLLNQGESKELGLEVLVTGGTGTYTYTWLSDGIQLATTPTLTINKTGTYQLVVRDTGSCRSLSTYSVTTSSGLDDPAEISTSVFPNPSKGIVRIKSSVLNELNLVSVFTSDGRLVSKIALKDNLVDNVKVLNLSFLPAGQYHLSMQFGKRIINRVLILE